MRRGEVQQVATEQSKKTEVEVERQRARALDAEYVLL